MCCLAVILACKWTAVEGLPEAGARLWFCGAAGK